MAQIQAGVAMRLSLTQVVFLALFDVQAQTPPAAPLTFEVASIKPSAPDVGGIYMRPQPGGLRLEGATLKNLIEYAYDVRGFAISGGPAWANSDRFDVDARVGGSLGTPQQIRERLRALLGERFKLAVHTESREQNVYYLVVSKNGPKFHEAKPDSRQMIRRRGASITGEAAGVGMLVLNLANALERPVLDKTGLTGRYDFKLEWSLSADRQPGSVAETGGEAPKASEPSGPALFAALQEQLGLRLEAQKAPAETLVIDHVDRPSEN
jgi:uncharacterized protein (TIGR03435 family)